MITCLFRFLNDAGQPTGRHGAASVPCYRDLFWLIDEFGDPYSCEISRIDQVAICFQTKPDLDNEGYLNQDGETEFSESISICEDTKWKLPDWKKLLKGKELK